MEPRDGTPSFQPGSGQEPGDTYTVQGIGMHRLLTLLRIENDFIEPSLEAQPPEGLYIARTLVRDG
jgi:hypothetical protein